MANPNADFPTQVHSPTDTSAFSNKKLGLTSPKHTEVEGKQEQEVVAVQTKLGHGASVPGAGKYLKGAADGSSSWVIPPWDEAEIDHNALKNFEAGEHFTMLDENDFASDSETKAATQQSIKAYIASQIATANELTELTDVVITGVGDNEVLAYDNTSSKWINQTAGEAGLAVSGHNHDTVYLKIASNLSDLNNAATARTNLGLVAGGVGDIWVEKAGDTMIGTDSTTFFQIQQADTSVVFNVDTTNARVGIGTSSPDSALHIKADFPAGQVGNNYAGQIIIQNPTDSVFSNVVITAYESDAGGNPDQQLWYLGSSSVNNSDIIFLNRRNSKLALGTNNTSRITILGSGNVGIGVTDPDTKLEILNAGDQLKLSFDGTDNAVFAVDTNGVLTVTPSGTKVIIAGGLDVTGVTTVSGNILSDTDSTDDLGSSSIFWANAYIDAIKTIGITADDGAGSANLNLQLLGKGTGYVQVGSTASSQGLNTVDDLMVGGHLEVNDIAYFDNTVYCAEDIYFAPIKVLRFNSSSPPAIGLKNAGAQTDPLFLFTGATDQVVIVTAYDNRFTDHGHSGQTNPTLYVHSVNAGNTEWISLTHNQTDGVIQTGEGNLTIGSGADSHSLSTPNDLFVTGDFEVDGKAWFDGIVEIAESVVMYATKVLSFNAGNPPVIGLKNAGNQTDCLSIYPGATDNYILLTDYDNRNFDHGHAAQADPTLFIHSINQTTDEWLSLTHDQTDGVINVGKGGLSLFKDSQSGDDNHELKIYGYDSADDGRLEYHRIYLDTQGNLVFDQNPGGGGHLVLGFHKIISAGDLVPDNDSEDDLGVSDKYWAEGYIDKIYLNSTASLDGSVAGDITVTGDLALGTAGDILIGSGSAKIGAFGDIDDRLTFDAGGNSVQWNNCPEWYFPGADAKIQFWHENTAHTLSIENGAANGLAHLSIQDNITAGGNVLPAVDSASDLGSSAPKYFANAYIDRVYLNATAYLDGATAGKVITNVAIRGATSIWWRVHHIDLASTPALGAVGAVYTPQSANNLNGYQLDNAPSEEYLYFNVHIGTDWDEASDLELVVQFETNVDNSGGNVGDTVDFDLLMYYKKPGDATQHTQDLDASVVVGQAVQYTHGQVTFTIDHDLVDHVVEIGDCVSFRLHLNTTDSEVVNVIVHHAMFRYKTKKVRAEV